MEDIYEVNPDNIDMAVDTFMNNGHAWGFLPETEDDIYE